MMLELKPCPFCGRPACVAVSDKTSPGKWYAKVGCEMNGGCGAAVKIKANSAQTAKRRAIEVWNMIAGLVKHGRWKKRGRNLGECSECGEVVIVRYPYCPNCGAKMDEEGSNDK